VDVSPEVAKRNKIYHISTSFPFEHPYSKPSDWKKAVDKFMDQGEDQMILDLLQLHNRNWIKEQIDIQTEISNDSSASFESLLLGRKFLQLRESFNWVVWALGQYYFNQKYEGAFNLPKYNNRLWNDGFVWKGIFIRVLPYEDAYFVRNELQALKFIHTELLELGSLSTQLQAQYSKEHLHKDVILPLLSAISNNGFFLYASPVIYT